MNLREKRNVVVDDLDVMHKCITDYQDDAKRIDYAIAFIDELIVMIEKLQNDAREISTWASEWDYAPEGVKNKAIVYANGELK